MAKKQKESSSGRASPPRPGEPVYTMMAFITLVAIALGCTLLYMDFDEYGQKQPPAEKIPPLPKLGEETKTGAPAAPVAAPAAQPAQGMPANQPMPMPTTP